MTRCATGDGGVVMTRDEAIEIVARGVANDGIRKHCEDSIWELYPEIGESDFEEVVEKAWELAIPIEEDRYEEAYALLEERARKWTEEHTDD